MGKIVQIRKLSQKCPAANGRRCLYLLKTTFQIAVFVCLGALPTTLLAATGTKTVVGPAPAPAAAAAPKVAPKKSNSAKKSARQKINEIREKNKSKTLKIGRVQLFISLSQLNYEDGTIDPIPESAKKIIKETYKIDRIYHPNELDGATIETEGFGMPLQMDEYVTELMFVGNEMFCKHQASPPPPNQAVHVKIKTSKKNRGIPMKSFIDVTPVKLKGRLRVIRKRSAFGEAGYEVEAVEAIAGKAMFH